MIRFPLSSPGLVHSELQHCDPGSVSLLGCAMNTSISFGLLLGVLFFCTSAGMLSCTLQKWEDAKNKLCGVFPYFWEEIRIIHVLPLTVVVMYLGV